MHHRKKEEEDIKSIDTNNRKMFTSEIEKETSWFCFQLTEKRHIRLNEESKRSKLKNKKKRERMREKSRTGSEFKTKRNTGFIREELERCVAEDFSLIIPKRNKTNST